jgi:hypothetical protein
MSQPVKSKLAVNFKFKPPTTSKRHYIWVKVKNKITYKLFIMILRIK